MDSIGASALMEYERGGAVFPASQEAIAQDEGHGVGAGQLADSVQWDCSGRIGGGRNARAGAIRSLMLAGPAGRLEAILNEGAPDARFAALVCHPHPLGGGNLHNKVVYHAMKTLNDAAWGLGCPVLRFNFRGTGLSEGAHDGEAEMGDVLAAMDWLEREFRLPLIVAGFSFGAATILRALSEPGAARHDVRALIALGLPTAVPGRAYRYCFLQNLTLPKLFLSGDRDPFAPAEQWTEVVASAAEPKHYVSIPDADHFFTDRLAPMQQALAGWLKEQLP